MKDNELLTTAQLAKLAGVTTSAVYFWKKKGIGPPMIKEGGKYFYRFKDVKVWLGKTKFIIDELE